MKKIRILMLSLKVGGIEKQTINMANILAKKYDVELISLYNYQPAYPISKLVKIKYLTNLKPNKEKLINSFKKFKIISIFKEGIKASYILFTKYYQLIKYIKNTDADILFSTRIEFAHLISKYNKKKIYTISQEHNYFEDEKYIKKIRKAFINIDTVVVMTEYAKKNYDKWLSNNKTVVIPNMLSEIPDFNAELNGKNLIAIGRLEEVKDYESLLRVYKKVTNLDKEVKLTIIGHGSYYQKLVTMANDLKLDINFTKELNAEEVNKHLVKSDLLVITSKRECFPMVILESYAVGVPVISYPIKSGPISMINPACGILLDKKDENLMAKEIIKYLNNKNRKKMSFSCKKEALKYHPDEISKKWFKIMENV